MSLKSMIDQFAKAIKTATGSSASVSITHTSTSGHTVSMINGRVFVNGVEQGASPGSDRESQDKGKRVQQERSPGHFHALRAGGLFDITWSPGEPGLTLTGPENLLALVHTAVDSEGRLKIGLLRPAEHLRGEIVIECRSPSLRDIELSGQASGSFHALGDSESALSASLSGSAQAVFEGQAQSLKLSCSGSSDANSDFLLCDSVQLNASGSAKASALFCKSLDIDASGAAELLIKGSGSAQVKGSGSSQITHMEGSMEASVDLSGAASARLHLHGNCRLRASGSSLIQRSGEARCDESTQGAGSIKNKGSARSRPFGF